MSLECESYIEFLVAGKKIKSKFLKFDFIITREQSNFIMKNIPVIYYRSSLYNQVYSFGITGINKIKEFSSFVICNEGNIDDVIFESKYTEEVINRINRIQKIKDFI